MLLQHGKQWRKLGEIGYVKEQLGGSCQPGELQQAEQNQLIGLMIHGEVQLLTAHLLTDLKKHSTVL